MTNHKEHLEHLEHIHRLVRNANLYWTNITPGKYDIIWAKIWILVEHIESIVIKEKYD